MCKEQIVPLYLNIPIYHFMRLEYLVQMLRSKEMKVAKIQSWDDKWEGFFLRKRYNIDGKHLETDSILSSIYGQSWTMTDPDIYDILWRCYNNELVGYNYVAIKTSVLKLRNVVNMNFNEMQRSGIYLGPILYRTQEEIVSEIASARLEMSSQIHEDIIDACFSKRDTFEYEKELRLIFFDDDQSENNATLFSGSIENSGLLKVPVGDDFIEEVIIDPRLMVKKNECYKQRLLDALYNIGLQDGKIRISRCYDFQK